MITIAGHIKMTVLGRIILIIFFIGMMSMISEKLNPVTSVDTHNKRSRMIHHQKSVLKIPQIPKRQPGDVNFPDVLYHSVIVFAKLFGSRSTVNLRKTETFNFSNPVLKKAQDNLVKAYGYRDVDLYKSLYNLRILRQRTLSITPRPLSCHRCMQFEHFKTLLYPGEVCRNDGTIIDLIVVITTTPQATAARNAMRETYLKSTKDNTGNIRYVFLIGSGWPEHMNRALVKENRKYHDILQQDYKDGYYNLTYKVLSGLKWAVDHCPQANFVARSADDIYLNMPNLWRLLRVHTTHLQDVQIGSCFGKGKVNRTSWSRFHLSKNDYQGNTFPPFCLGTTYIFSMKTTKRILAHAVDVPWFPLEDHWFGMVMEKAGIGTKSVKGFNVVYHPDADIENNLEWRKKKGVCNFARKWFTLHRVTPKDIRTVHSVCVKEKY